MNTLSKAEKTSSHVASGNTKTNRLSPWQRPVRSEGLSEYVLTNLVKGRGINIRSVCRLQLWNSFSDNSKSSFWTSFWTWTMKCLLSFTVHWTNRYHSFEEQVTKIDETHVEMDTIKGSRMSNKFYCIHMLILGKILNSWRVTNGKILSFWGCGI